MAEQRIISADSHVMEPANLWQERLDRNLRDQAPRVVKNEARAGYSFVAPGMTPFPAAGGFAIGKSGEELREHLNKGYEAARPSGWDPAERLKDQDLDGVTAEVLNTTLGMPLFRLPDLTCSGPASGGCRPRVRKNRTNSCTRLRISLSASKAPHFY